MSEKWGASYSGSLMTYLLVSSTIPEIFGFSPSSLTSQKSYSILSKSSIGAFESIWPTSSMNPSPYFYFKNSDEPQHFNLPFDMTAIRSPSSSASSM